MASRSWKPNALSCLAGSPYSAKSFFLSFSLQFSHLNVLPFPTRTLGVFFFHVLDFDGHFNRNPLSLSFRKSS